MTRTLRLAPEAPEQYAPVNCSGRACTIGSESYREQRITEECARQGEQGDRERRVLDVAPGQVVCRGQVVEFVADETITIGSGDVETELDRRESNQGNQRTVSGWGPHAGR